MYQIEKNVPLPSRRNVYPFADMEIGDSFVVDVKDFGKVRSAAFVSGKKSDKKFTCNAATNRVWRIA